MVSAAFRFGTGVPLNDDRKKHLVETFAFHSTLEITTYKEMIHVFCSNNIDCYSVCFD